MLLIFLSNLGMGGSESAVTVAVGRRMTARYDAKAMTATTKTTVMTIDKKDTTMCPR